LGKPKPQFQLGLFFSLLHYSSRLSDEGKFGSGASSKPGLLGGSLQAIDAAEMRDSLLGGKEGINYG